MIKKHYDLTILLQYLSKSLNTATAKLIG